MQTDWESFLINRGAELSNGIVAHYGNPEQELSVTLSGNIICDLSHYALLAISGEDASAFLHSQFINDIQNLGTNQSQLNGYCNPKGRMITDFRVFRRDAHLYLRLPRNMADILNKRLSMYIMRSKVIIEDGSDHFVRMGYSGPTADKALAEIVGQIPETIDQVVHADNTTIIRIPGITPSYEIYGDESSMQKLWEKLDVQGAPVGTHGWELIEILAGIPHITPETSEQFVPQMMNYQAIGGLSFKKGCYPGQEIVARMHYLGKLKKRTYLTKIRCDDAPLPFQNLVSSKKDSGSNAGNIINVAKHPDGYYVALAVIQISDAISTTIHLGDISGPELDMQELPYPVELKSP